MADDKEVGPGEVRVKLKWIEGADIPSFLADEAAIQFLGERFYLTIGEVLPPSIPASIQEGSTLEAKPVARLIFTKTSFLKISGIIEKAKNVVTAKDAAAKETR